MNTTMHPDPDAQEEFVLRLRPLPNDKLRRTPEARLKALLKAALRAYGMQATRLEPAKGDDLQQTAPPR